MARVVRDCVVWVGLLTSPSTYARTRLKNRRPRCDHHRATTAHLIATIAYLPETQIEYRSALAKCHKQRFPTNAGSAVDASDARRASQARTPAAGTCSLEIRLTFFLNLIGSRGLAHDKRAVGSAEAEGIRQRNLNVLLARTSRYEI